MKRALCLILALVMMISNFPMAAAASETDAGTEYVRPVPETVTSTETIYQVEQVADGIYSTTETEVTSSHQLPMESLFPEEPEVNPVSTLSIEGSGTSYTFTTFEDLQELAAGTYSSKTYAHYSGTEALVISQNLTMPDNLLLYADDARVTIAKGATFHASGFTSVKELVVNGTAHLEYIHIDDVLTVTGKIYANSTIRMTNGMTATVTGAGNVVFANNWNTLEFWTTITSMDALNTAVAKAKASTNSRYEYLLSLNGDIVISNSLTTPDNCKFLTTYASSVVIDSGCTLTLNGYGTVNCPVTVNGSLVNNLQLSIGEYQDDASLHFASGASYSGNGRIIIYLEDIADPADVITGLDMEQFEINQYTDYSYYWELRYIGNLTRLPKPTNLKWGKLYTDLWNESTGQWETETLSIPGAVSWKFAKPNLGQATFRIFNEEGTNVTTFRVGWHPDYLPDICSHAFFCTTDPASGTYYFTVTSEGDYETYYASAAAKSGTFEYTKPSKKVGKCTSPKWSGIFANFTAPSATAYVTGYQIMFYFSPTKNGTPQQISNQWSYQGSSAHPGFYVANWMLNQYGPGYYSFKIRALSSDLTKRCNGAWSDLSAPKYFEPFDVSVSNRASDGKPKLAWDMVDGAASYSIFRSTDPNGSYTHLTNTTKTTLVNTSAKSGKLYYYFVNAFDADGNFLRQSDVVSRRCDLPRPTVTLSSVASSGKIKVSWSAIDGAQKYEVYRSGSKSGTYTKLGSTTKSSYTDSSAVAGKTYYYKVKAIHSKSAANSALSEAKYRTCDLARPTITLSSVASTGKIKISWAAVEGAAKYEVYRSTSKNGTYTRLGTTTKTSYINNNAKAGTTYYYKVKAIHEKSAANSAFSAYKSRMGDLPHPEVSIKLNSSGKPRLSWTAVDGAVKYEIYRTASKTGEYSLVKTTTNTYWVNTGAVAGKTYYYKVKAIHSKSAASSAFSTIVSATAE